MTSPYNGILRLLTIGTGAIQASVSVLLTIGFGVISSQFNLLSEASAKQISTVGVKLFLPSLLLTNIGNQLSAETGHKYLPIVVWSLLYNAISITMGLALRKALKLPAWTTPAITFNNSISMPLLLTEALGHTNILEPLLQAQGDNLTDALNRTKSFFLVNSMIADSLTFGLGPKLLGLSESSAQDGQRQRQSPFNAVVLDLSEVQNKDAEHERALEEDRLDAEDEQQEEHETRENEESTLLPKRVVRSVTNGRHAGYRRVRRMYDRLPLPLRRVLGFIGTFINAPLIGTVIGVVIALIPPLKRAFFAEAEQGGVFNAWLTTSVRNVGELFPALQVVVVGVKLRQSLYAMKKGEEGGELPWLPMICVLVGRFILWPAISIPLVWVLAAKTRLLPPDPFLFFAMAIMPCGPPALKLTALADVTGSSEREKMSIAKFLTVAYAFSPVLAFAVVGVLNASQDAVSARI